jgi:hypothetical protein
MSMTSAIRREHEDILAALAAIDREVHAARESGGMPTPRARHILGFIHDYVHAFHQSREECHVLPAAIVAGPLPLAAAADGILDDHIRSRRVMRSLLEAISCAEVCSSPLWPGRPPTADRVWASGASPHRSGGAPAHRRACRRRRRRRRHGCSG